MDDELRIQNTERDISAIRDDFNYLRPLVLRALEYMATDPAASLNKARIAGEALSKRLFPSRAMLNNLKSH